MGKSRVPCFLLTRYYNYLKVDLGALVVTHAMLRRLISWRCIIIIIITTQAEIRTCNVPIANPALYHTATSAPVVVLVVVVVVVVVAHGNFGFCIICLFL